MAEYNDSLVHTRWMIAILLLAFLLRIAYLDAESLWGDEAMSAVVGNTDLPSAIENRSTGGGAAGFLYFLALHFWLGVGQSEFAVRLLSVIFGVLGVAGMFPLAALVGGKRLGVISAFAVAISPFRIWYSQEARTYSLLLLLTVLGVYFFFRLLREDKLSNWLAYGILTLAALYTHYITPFILLAEMTYLTLMRKRYRAILGKWLLCMIVLGALLTPWLILSFSRGGLAQAPISWIPASRPEDLFWTIYNLGLGSTSDSTHPFNILTALLITAILACVSFRLVRGKMLGEQRDRLWFVVALAGTAADVHLSDIARLATTPEAIGLRRPVCHLPSPRFSHLALPWDNTNLSQEESTWGARRNTCPDRCQHLRAFPLS
jgi:uncharacterized membrane protein